MLDRIQRQNIINQGLKRGHGSWFSKLTSILQRYHVDETVWDDIEELLISGDVGISTAMRLIEQVKNESSHHKIENNSQIIEILKGYLVSILSGSHQDTDVLSRLPTGRPYVILVVGVNGVGKTTSIAKLAHYFTIHNRKVLIAASDTFRSAAIEQLQQLGKSIGSDVIAHGHGGDPAAVAFDALEAARARSIDILIVDTAGRMHTSHNLMDEIKKIYRVINRFDPNSPDEVLLVLDSTTGQNGIAQANSFLDAVGCTGILLSKLDGTARGGIVIPIVETLGIPVLYVGTGESINDFAMFEPSLFIDELFSNTL